MSDRDSLHDLSALDPQAILMLIADRQLEQKEDIAALRCTLHGDDGRGGLVADVAWLRARLSGSLRPPPAATWIDVVRAYAPYAAAIAAIAAAAISAGACAFLP